jgi:hypothetical protein
MESNPDPEQEMYIRRFMKNKLSQSTKILNYIRPFLELEMKTLNFVALRYSVNKKMIDLVFDIKCAFQDFPYSDKWKDFNDRISKLLSQYAYRTSKLGPMSKFFSNSQLDEIHAIIKGRNLSVITRSSWKDSKTFNQILGIGHKLNMTVSLAPMKDCVDEKPDELGRVLIVCPWKRMSPKARSYMEDRIKSKTHDTVITIGEHEYCETTERFIDANYTSYIIDNQYINPDHENVTFENIIENFPVRFMLRNESDTEHMDCQVDEMISQ